MSKNFFELMRVDICEVMDPRSGPARMRRHNLFDIIIIGLCCMIVGGDGFDEMREFGLVKEQWLRQFLELPSGIPSISTFRRLFTSLDPKEITGLLNKFTRDFVALMANKESCEPKPSLAIDGKTLRGSRDKANDRKALHSVSIFDTQAELTLGEIAVDDKSNEITAIPKLLDLIDISGAVVTIDAMGCQKKIAHKIISKGAGFMLALKKNHGDLFSSVESLFSHLPSLHDLPDSTGRFTTVEKGHGRIETRTYLAIDSVKAFGLSSDWPAISSFVAIDATRETSKGTTTERRYYISSETPHSEIAGHYVRAHWGIENKLHWVLDVTSREDASRIRVGHAAENIGILRRLALNLIKSLKIKKLSVRLKKFKAAISTEFLTEVLFQANVLAL